MLCRICVRDAETFQFLVNLKYGGMPATLFIKESLKVDVSNDQGNQLIICGQCHNKLCKFASFYSTVQEAQVDFKPENGMDCQNSEQNAQTSGDLNNSMEGSQLERENDCLSRSEIATNQMLAKYKMEEMYHNGKWLLSEDLKDEMLSLYIDMKCFKCNLPDFPNYKDLCEHSMTEHGEIPKVKCCRFLTLQKEGLETHILYEHIRKSTQPKRIVPISECHVCHKPPMECICKRPLHTNSSGGKMRKCQICGTLVRRVALARHTKTHIPKWSKKCYFCLYIGTDMEEHFRMVHEQDMPFRCFICPKAFTTESAVKTHRKKRHLKHTVDGELKNIHNRY